MHGFTRDFIDWPYSSHYFGPFLLYFHGCSRLFKGIKLHLKPLEVIYSAVLCLQHTLCLIAKQKKEGGLIHRADPIYDQRRYQLMMCSTNQF